MFVFINFITFDYEEIIQVLEHMYNEMISSITKVTQNNTGMYSKEASQQTFKIPNNSNFDMRFEKAYLHHNNEILHTIDQK